MIELMDDLREGCDSLKRYYEGKEKLQTKVLKKAIRLNDKVLLVGDDYNYMWDLYIAKQTKGCRMSLSEEMKGFIDSEGNFLKGT